MLSDDDFRRALADEFPGAIPEGEDTAGAWVFPDGSLYLYGALSDVRDWVSDSALEIEGEQLPLELHELLMDLLVSAAFHADQGDKQLQREYVEQYQAILRGRPMARPKVSIREGGHDILQRFWALIERAAEDADQDRANLLMIELYEGVGWTEDVIDYLGPRALRLLADAREQLADANREIGRWSDTWG